MKRIITAIVYNHAGVLNRIISVLNRRQFNIESITVGEAEKDISHMTIVIQIENLAEAEQVIKQIHKQIEVLKASDITEEPHIERELALIKIHAPPSMRTEIHSLILPFRADIVDVGQKTLTIQVVGTQEKIRACIEILRPYGIKKIARTGITSLKRG
ncbi:acetolactate synthase small subunit [Helicobacter mustelae]|uniref:Acetolactate synthase small subunit n=1 Tax=Helicobacter mustelae (strain ATCC 43772 / CCUG 25715 / CIP 103759 / LMG 18044 / NCTC 12198 / R85-136P) TaxID=679897 RepID=D3UIV8_HELM1|nr:acetolactate synthase small subunit [Helicobacter mustelae]CBG40433.1 acetolactate synthase small subunit [Helicobacter mustelae 12198]SQH71933.1 acetolactate synthase small subunit [Helicobacter mustelae]STP13074.1 acetolactate synthase small subunit [Helicobacter mustelae]